MLDADSDGERLLLQRNFVPIKQAVDIPGGMPRRKNDSVARDFFGIIDDEPLHFSILDEKVSDLRFKANIAPGINDGLPDCFDDVGEKV
jgi:hypothetical protein